MEFSINKYFNIEGQELTNKDVIQLFVNDVESWTDSICNLIQQAVDDPEFVYPNSSKEVYFKMRDLTILSCLLNYKISENPIFALNAESIFLGQKAVTIDIFHFFLKLFADSIPSDANINLTGIQRILDRYDSLKGRVYSISIVDLVRTNINDISESRVQLKGESEIK